MGKNNFKVLMVILALCIIVLILFFRTDTDVAQTIVLSFTLLFVIVYAHDNRRVADFHVQHFKALFINLYLEQFGQRIAGAKRDVVNEIEEKQPVENKQISKIDAFEQYCED